MHLSYKHYNSKRYLTNVLLYLGMLIVQYVCVLCIQDVLPGVPGQVSWEIGEDRWDSMRKQRPFGVTIFRMLLLPSCVVVPTVIAEVRLHEVERADGRIVRWFLILSWHCMNPSLSFSRVLGKTEQRNSKFPVLVLVSSIA